VVVVRKRYFTLKERFFNAYVMLASQRIHAQAASCENKFTTAAPSQPQVVFRWGKNRR
jgi:hypothetical protein